MILQRFTIAVLCLFLVSCVTHRQQTDVTVRKSPNDDREYRYLVLDNALRVLLVADAKTDKAAASLSVLRGSYHEPEEYPGLAHFLEHMLFIGTEKYPEVDGYQQFIATHGGSSNAYTAAEHTNYFFDIQVDQFAEGMDRFAQFFISPLLAKQYVDREKHAVDSEYQLQIKDDNWRGFSVLKAAMRPDYPGSRFTIGSLATLGDGVDEALIEFFETEYSADQMILVALSNESLDDLEDWIRPMFGAIENHAIGPATTPGRAFAQEQLPAVLTHQSLRDQRRISFNFPIPATEPYYQKKPAQYITNLLGHEGDGSLHQLLKAKGWIESLAAGVSRLDDANAFLSVDIEINQTGAGHIEEIGQLLFGYLELLRSKAPQAWRYEEQAVVAQLGFQFQEQSSATGFVYRTSPAFALYPPADVLIAPYLMDAFDAQLIESYLTYLTPDNVLLEVVGPDVHTDQLETWFKVPYKLEQRRISGAPQQASLRLPDKNQFLPEKLSLLEDDTIGPVLIVARPGLELWLDRDAEFGVPRANLYFNLGVRNGLTTPEDIVLAQLYQRLVSDALNEYAYPALLAGLGYRLAVTSSGFQIRVSGYSDQQPELLSAVLDKFRNMQLDASRFELYQSELVREWTNFRNERPYTQTYAALNNLLLSTSWSPLVLADYLRKVDLNQLANWREAKLSEFSIRGLAHGNIDEARLNGIAADLAKALPLKEFNLVKPAVVDITDPWLLAVEVDHNDASIALHIQDSESSYEQRARSALAGQILSQEYFSSLRTEQQLGYVVSLSSQTKHDRGGLTFIIQSPVASPGELETATIAFMDTQLKAFASMSDETFARQKAGLVSRLTERDKNLRDRTSRYWSDLNLDVTSFDSRQQIAAIVESLSKEQMAEFLDGVVKKLTTARILVYSNGKFETEPKVGRQLDGAAAFKNS